MPPRHWSRAWLRAIWMRHLSGLTLPRSTLDRGAESWIASLLAIRASPTASPASVAEQKTTDSSSTRCCESSRNAGLIVSSVKTSRGTRTASSPPSSDHWRQWVTALRQESSARPRSAPASEESDCSSWPTAKVASGGYEVDSRRDPPVVMLTLQGAAVSWGTPQAHERAQSPKAKHHGVEMANQVAQWITPNVPNGGRAAQHAEMVGRTAMHAGKKVQIGLEHQVRQWPSPAARDHKGANSTEHVTTNGSGRMHMDQLPNFVEHGFRYSAPDQATHAGPQSSSERRVLNPQFVEWLMGWPIGWTGSGPAATEFTHWLRRMRGALSMLSTPPAEMQGKLL